MLLASRSLFSFGCVACRRFGRHRDIYRLDTSGFRSLLDNLCPDESACGVSATPSGDDNYYINLKVTYVCIPEFVCQRPDSCWVKKVISPLKNDSQKHKAMLAVVFCRVIPCFCHFIKI